MNVSEKTVLNGIEKTGCTVGHIQHCLNNPKMHGNLSYDYFGKTSQRGAVELYTKNGIFKAFFSCKNGWLKEFSF